MPLIEVGKKYIARNGCTIEITRENKCFPDIKPFFGVVTNQDGSEECLTFLFNHFGRHMIEKESAYDIVGLKSV